MPGSEHSPEGDNRAKLLALLCSGDRTTGELAQELGVSANAVRGHLLRLEQEGLVGHRAVRRGVGKPAHAYHLTPEGSVRLSRAYLPLLSAILSVVGGRADAEDEEALLRQAGRALALQRARPEGALRERVDAAAGLLRELGGIAVFREETDALWIQGTCCPLRALVPDHPLACKAIEVMLEEYIGAPVRERCEKNNPPICQLVIGAANP